MIMMSPRNARNLENTREFLSALGGFLREHSEGGKFHRDLSLCDEYTDYLIDLFEYWERMEDKMEPHQSDFSFINNDVELQGYFEGIVVNLKQIQKLLGSGDGEVSAQDHEYRRQLEKVIAISEWYAKGPHESQRSKSR